MNAQLKVAGCSAINLKLFPVKLNILLFFKRDEGTISDTMFAEGVVGADDQRSEKFASWRDDPVEHRLRP